MTMYVGFTTIIGPASGIYGSPGSMVHGHEVFEASQVIVSEEKVGWRIYRANRSRCGVICHEEISIPEGIVA